MSVIISDKSVTDFIHFILNALDAFANLFREQSIDGSVILSKCGRDTAVPEWAYAMSITLGPFIELCTNIESVVRDKKYKKYLTNNDEMHTREKWHTKDSKRTLAVINVENESKESENIWNGTVTDIKIAMRSQFFMF